MLGCYFLGNSVTNMNKDGWCVCVCGTEGASKQKATYQSFVMKERAGLCSKKAKVCSETGSGMSFLCCNDVRVCLLATLVHHQDLVDKRKEHLLVGSYCRPHFLHS